MGAEFGHLSDDLLGLAFGALLEDFARSQGCVRSGPFLPLEGRALLGLGLSPTLGFLVGAVLGVPPLLARQLLGRGQVGLLACGAFGLLACPLLGEQEVPLLGLGLDATLDSGARLVLLLAPDATPTLLVLGPVAL